MIGTTVGRYQVIEQLGTGAFGAVFRAHDPTLGRDVALKSLPLEVAGDVDEKRRLLREAMVLGRMEHAHIAGIHDVVEDSEGRTHIVLQLVSGETLESRLKKGPLSATEVVAIGRQLAAALAYAHSAGVVHRDIKPANICLTSEGSAKILDFGLARIFASPVAAGSTGVSQSGPASGLGPLVGTPAYMPPETFGGQPADARGDIYSLGVTLFEMLTAQRPFPADDLATLIPEITLKPVPRIEEFMPRPGKRLSAVITKAMNRLPSGRFETAAELEHALAHLDSSPLKRLAMIAGVGVLMIALAFVGVQLIDREPGDNSPPVLAVLPFSLISPDSTDRYLSEGMASTVAGELGMLALSVVPPRLTLPGSGEDASPEAGMKRTGSNYALLGSIEHSGPRLRVNLQLLRKGRAAALWTRVIDGKLDQGFELQATVARTVEEALSQHKLLGRPTSPELRDRLGTPATRDPVAFASYSKARALLDDYNLDDNLDHSIALFQASTREDSLYGSAFAGLGQAYLWKYDVTQDTTWISLADRALQSAERRSAQEPSVLLTRAELARRRGRHEETRAILGLLTKITPESDVPWASMGASYWSSGDFKNAETSYREAIRRRPDYWEHHNELGRTLQKQKRFAEAIQEYEEVNRLQPDNPRGLANIATVYFVQGDTANAGRYARESIAIRPSYGPLSTLGYLAFNRGNYAEAAIYYQRVADLTPNDPVAWRNLGDVQQAASDTASARTSYDRVIALCSTTLNLDSRNLKCLRLRALCLAKNGRFDEGRRDILRALAQVPTDGECIYTHCVVETLSENYPRALGLLREAIRQGKAAAEARADPDLALLRRSTQFDLVLGGS